MNSELDEAIDIDASEPIDAANEYAMADEDGQCDGLYFSGPHPICVMGPDGNVLRFDVSAKMVPVFRAREQTEGGA
jgi:hypothetical protein